MECIMQIVTIRDEFIKLGQAMKLAGLVDSGVEAKDVITAGEVFVNGKTDTRRGRKLYNGDVVTWKGKQFEISAKQ